MAGIAAAWTADLIPGQRAWRVVPESASRFRRAGNGLTLVCAGLGAAPDLDLLLGGHRTVTHSLGAVIFVWLFAAALAANAERPIVRVSLMCAAAYGTHLLLDWLGTDRISPRGIEILWPLNHEWYTSGTDVFRQTARQEFLTAPILLQNLRAIVQELVILGPTLVALWLVRVKALAGLSSEVTRGDHAAQ
ncbi:MAG: hypothetical protein A3F69_00300 [Acidobacteria bacterium RIFCSPLOWO2_12_FULL_66_10]|nr:MAG: hypothetical protein A3F69_00300 [Acidobacteria bacterium RIFCSPLOWO2_12_FULL_66_10]